MMLVESYRVSPAPQKLGPTGFTGHLVNTKLEHHVIV